MQKPKLWVVLSDIHAPEEHPASLRAVLKFLEQNPIAGVVLLGDNMDCQDVSRHTKGRPGLRKRGGWQKDLDYFNANILLPIEERLSNSTQRVFFKGNHEDWLNQLLEEQPELEGALSIERSLQLEKRGWQVVQQGGHFRIGKAYLIHGDQIGSGKHIAAKLVDAFCSTVIMGHVHTAQLHVKTSQVKQYDKWAGYVLPTLGTVAPSYAKSKSNNHVQGFGIVEKYGAGLVNVYIVIITEGQFSFGGRIYSGTR